MGFPAGFVWGVASSAYQIEGAAYEDGKGETVWDRFSRRPGAVHDGHTGDVACDHYHRYAEDFRLMAELGIRHHRFSVCWPRLLPEGTGRLNEAGLDHYDRLIDAMLENGITPWLTLFHWEYPMALQQRGAWENPDSPKWFAEYARAVAARYADRVGHFFTLNEPQCFIGLGYVTGEHAPGLKLPVDATIPMAHNALIAHGLAVQALRAESPRAKIGYAPCSSPICPATDAEADVEAARGAYFSTPADRGFFSTAWWSDPALLGRYPEDGLKLYGQYLPALFERDLATICQRLDYYGQNIYSGSFVKAGPSGPEPVKLPVGTAKTGMNWPVTPECLYWGPKFLSERYGVPVIITENGMADLDAVSRDGKVHDPARQNYLSRYIEQFRRAADDGVPVAGYFCWSFLDNFEWAMGYRDRFGLVYVDYETQRRIPKDSAYWYQGVIESNGAVLF
ncbi:GH1 family beta-glucosidase [Bacillota bacterium Meth-B3]